MAADHTAQPLVGAQLWRRTAFAAAARKDGSNLTLLAAHAVREGRGRHERRQAEERARKQAEGCCCWDVCISAPTACLWRCVAALWTEWLRPPLRWVLTVWLRVVSMLMDAFSMLFMAFEQDLRYREENAHHGEHNISHALHQLSERHFHGKGVATTDEMQLWISLFYSPRSPQGVDQLGLLNEAARQLDKVMADAGDWPRRIAGHVCPAYAHRSVHLGVVNIDDMLANNDELAINMGISDLSPTFLLLDGDNVPMKIDQHHIDELLEKGSDFWSERRCMHAFERLLAVISEERRERHAVQTDAVHALIVKTATPKGAFDSFISKYGDRRRLLRCAQHILRASPA